MQSASMPKDEAERLQALFEYHVLDTDPEEAFDQLTELVASICDVPIALVSLIDEKRQWFKSHHGLDATETPRELAFCAHAILQDDVFEIPDSSRDNRFCDNPLVTGDPNVAFYAGAPLKGRDGHNVGTLCVIDHKPKMLTDDQRRQLTIIANQVVALLELRKSNLAKDDLFSKLMNLNELINRKNEELNSFSNQVAHDCRGPLGQIDAFSELCQQDLKAQDLGAASEKLAFIRRSVKNLNALLANILHLARAGFSCDLVETIDFNLLVNEVISNLDHEGVEIKTHIELTSLFLSESVRIKQIIYNLVSNGVKYSNSNRAKPFVSISVSGDENEVLIEVKDNGLGIEKQFHDQVFKEFTRFIPKVAEGSGVGMAIVKRHVDALGGTIDFSSSDEGTHFWVKLPKSQS